MTGSLLARVERTSGLVLTLALGLILVSYPALIGGLGWRTAFAFLPDLTLSVTVIAGLAVITGTTRTTLLIRRLRDSARSEDPTQDQTPTPQVHPNHSEQIPTRQLTGGRT